MSWAEVKKINSDMTKPLDTLISEKTDIKIQTVTVTIPSITYTALRTSSTGTATLSQVDIEKSILIPISPVFSDEGSGYTITALAYNLSDTSVSITVTFSGPTDSNTSPLQYTVAVLTFGATVNGN